MECADNAPTRKDVRNDLGSLGVKNWKQKVQERKQWEEIIEQAKTHKELYSWRRRRNSSFHTRLNLSKNYPQFGDACFMTNISHNDFQRNSTKPSTTVLVAWCHILFEHCKHLFKGILQNVLYRGLVQYMLYEIWIQVYAAWCFSWWQTADSERESYVKEDREIIEERDRD